MENIQIKTEPDLIIKQEEPQLSSLTDHIIKSEEIELKQEPPETSPEDPYHRCPECLFKSKLRSSLQTHIKRRHPGLVKDYKPFKCTSCRYSAISEANLLKHLDVCHEKKLECRFCPFQTKCKKKLTMHAKMKHEMEENKKEEVWERCLECFFRTKDIAKLERHVRMRHKVEEELFSSTVCDFKSTSLYNCKVHLEDLTNHCCQSEGIKSESIEVEKLKDLDVNFRFDCDKCDYKTNMSMDRKRRHTETLNWVECDQCDFKTKRKRNLTKHMEAKHVPLEKIRWIQCPHCPYRAKTQELYKKHQSYKHADFFKWFKCDHCEFTTKRNYALKVHVNAKHTAEDQIKWFECTQCAYRSKTKDSLKQHRSNIHEVNKTKLSKTFECEVCGRAFCRPSNVKLHVKMQHSNLDDVRRFKCELCSYKSKWCGDLKRHVKRKHV